MKTRCALPLCHRGDPGEGLRPQPSATSTLKTSPGPITSRSKAARRVIAANVASDKTKALVAALPTALAVDVEKARDAIQSSQRQLDEVEHHAYNALIFLLMRYLKRHHNELWKSFAGRGFFAAAGGTESYRFVRTGFYALFQKDHRDLKDRRAMAYVYSIRALFVALFPLVAWHAKLH